MFGNFYLKVTSVNDQDRFCIVKLDIIWEHILENWFTGLFILSRTVFNDVKERWVMNLVWGFQNFFRDDVYLRICFSM